MVMVLRSGLMARGTKAIGREVECMDRDNSCWLKIRKALLVNLRMVCHVDLGSGAGQMEITMRVSMLKDTSRVREYSFLKSKAGNMMDFGNLVGCVEWLEFNGSMEPILRVSGGIARKRVKDSYILRMEQPIKVSLQETCQMVKVLRLSSMEVSTQATSLMVSSLAAVSLDKLKMALNMKAIGDTIRFVVTESRNVTMELLRSRVHLTLKIL